MANATIIYACTSDGLVILTRPGTLPEWLPPRRVLEGKVVTSAWAEPGPPIRLVAVASGALMVSENGGRTWEQVAMPAPITVLFSVGEPPLLIAAIRGRGIAKSLDGGTTWEVSPSFPASGEVISFCTGDNQAHFLLAGGSSIALISGDPHSEEWRSRPLTNTLTAIATDTTTGKLYATSPRGVEVSGDGGESWEVIKGSPLRGTVLAAIPGAAGKPAALVVGTEPGLSVSLDGGGTWQALELNEDNGVATLARDPERRDRLYAVTYARHLATYAGYLFESGNRGQAWELINPYPLPPATYLYVLRI